MTNTLIFLCFISVVFLYLLFKIIQLDRFSSAMRKANDAGYKRGLEDIENGTYDMDNSKSYYPNVTKSYNKLWLSFRWKDFSNVITYD